MKCAVCKGSGIAFHPPVSSRSGSIQMKGVACKSCDGTGYVGNRNSSRENVGIMQLDTVGKVIQYHHGLHLAKLSLEESLHVGAILMIEDDQGRVEFELSDIMVSQMHLGMALAGWVVVIEVPKEVHPGTKIYRISA